jgi:hypothetical protein
MSARHTVPFALLIALVAALGSSKAQLDEPPRIGAANRSAMVDSICDAIDSIYVIEEGAKQIVAGLRKNLAAGEYDEYEDPRRFAERLEEDAQAIHHDGHFRIGILPPLTEAAMQTEDGEDPLERERRRRTMRANNYGFKETKILPGGVGYLRFNQFSYGPEAFDAAAAAMNFVSNANAVILDLRNNGGGSAAMIRFIAGYLFEHKTHLINWEIRAENHTEQSFSLDHVPGQKFPDTPVYVLINGNTFSAAEEFSFDLKNLERATLVGETTGGGGHTVAGYAFEFDGFRLLIRLPYGRAYFPETGEGWEGVGVTPDVECPSDEALDVAHLHALRALAEAETDEVIRGQYEWALLDIESRSNPVELPGSILAELVGDYGPRHITMEEGILYYQREGRDRMRLEPMNEEVFRVGDLDYFRLSFERDEGGAVVRVIGHYEGGRTDSNERDEG